MREKNSSVTKPAQFERSELHAKRHEYAETARLALMTKLRHATSTMKTAQCQRNNEATTPGLYAPPCTQSDPGLLQARHLHPVCVLL